MAIISFKNKATHDINYGINSKESQRLLPRKLHKLAQMKLARLGAVTSLRDLIEVRGNRFEALKGERRGQFSFRINEQYRVCFIWKDNSAHQVEIVDYH